MILLYDPAINEVFNRPEDALRSFCFRQGNTECDKCKMHSTDFMTCLQQVKADPVGTMQRIGIEYVEMVPVPTRKGDTNG